MVELREIAKDNYEEIINLKVSENQESFVSSNVYSLAQAWIYRKTAYPFAVYADDKAVGFIMLGFYEIKNQYTLWRFMIDERYQNKGYGKKALNLAIEYLVKKFKVKEVFTGVALRNTSAKKFYNSFGFKETGITDGFQSEMKLEIQDAM